MSEVTPAHLIQRAARLTNVKAAQIYGPSRERHLCAVRAAVYWVARDSGCTISEIAREIARDRSSVLNALDQLPAYRKLYKALDGLIVALSNGSDGRFVFVPHRLPETVYINDFWTKQRLEDLDQMIRYEIPIREISINWNQPEQTIRMVRRNWLKKNGVRLKMWTSDEVEKAQQMHRSGMPVSKIAAALGRSPRSTRYGINTS